MTPQDDPRPADETVTADHETADRETADRETADRETSSVDPDTKLADEGPESADEDATTEPPPLDASGEQVDTTQLERSQNAIDEAREAVKHVAKTDSIDDEATGAGDLPAFAESTSDTDEPAGASEGHEENADSE